MKLTNYHGDLVVIQTMVKKNHYNNHGKVY